MEKRKSFLLRVDAEIYAQLRRWAGDEFRSLNGQIEFLLREALRKSGRLKQGATDPPPEDPESRLQAAPGGEPRRARR